MQTLSVYALARMGVIPKTQKHIKMENDAKEKQN